MIKGRFLLAEEELDGRGGLFGYKFTGGSTGLVTIYIEDDELWHPQMTFDIAWLPDLMQVAARAATQEKA